MSNTKIKRLPSSQIYTEEATLLLKVKEFFDPLVRYGIKVIRINERYNKGYSDLFICAKGRFIAAELKDDEGEASPQQLLFIRQMREAGALCGVCRSVKDVAALVEEAYEQMGETAPWI